MKMVPRYMLYIWVPATPFLSQCIKIKYGGPGGTPWRRSTTPPKSGTLGTFQTWRETHSARSWSPYHHHLHFTRTLPLTLQTIPRIGMTMVATWTPTRNNFTGTSLFSVLIFPVLIFHSQFYI